MAKKKRAEQGTKDGDLRGVRESGESQYLTTNQGLRINDDQNSLKAGERGPSLLEDFHLREKITHFDHERIPERVVHARGSAAHGYFQVYKSLAPLTKAAFLQDPSVKAPVFVRFSTVVGSNENWTSTHRGTRCWRERGDRFTETGSGDQQLRGRKRGP